MSAPMVPLGLQEDGSQLKLPLALLRQHALIRGISGAGKSRFLTGLVLALRRLQLRGEPLSLIVLDPINEIVSAVRQHSASQLVAAQLGARHLPAALRDAATAKLRAQASRTKLLDFSRADTGFRFNPLECPPGLSATDCVGDFLRSVSRLIGDLTEMRRLANVLRSVSMLLVKTSLVTGVVPTLHDLSDFLLLDSRSIEHLLQRLERRREAGNLHMPLRPDFVRRYLSAYFTGPPRGRLELVQSTLNLLAVYLADDRASRFVSAPHGNLDLEDTVNGGGGTLLVHLPSSVNPLTQKALGAMLINRVELICRRRPVVDVKAGKYPLTILVVDECGDYLGPDWASTISQCRNAGLALVLSHQTSAQFAHAPEMDALRETIEANTAIQVYFRLDLDADAERIARRVFRSRGTMLARAETELTTTEGSSSATSSAETITLQVSESRALSHTSSVSVSIGENQTLTVGSAKGVTHAETESVSLSLGESFSQVRTRSFTVSQTRSQTHVEATGVAEGESQSSSASEGYGSGDTSSFAAFTGEGMSLPIGLDAALGSGGAPSSRRQNKSEGSTRGGGSSSSHSLATSLAQAVSRVVSQSSSLARGTSHGESVGRSVSSGKTRSRTKTEGHAVSRGLSEVESLAEGLGRSLSWSRGTTAGRTDTHGRSIATGRSRSRTTGKSSSVSSKERRDYYSVGDEALIRGFELAELPPRTAWVLLRGSEACKITTFDVASKFPTKVAGIDGMALLSQLTRPAPAEPLPPLPLERRLTLAATAETATSLSFKKPAEKNPVHPASSESEGDA